jgi:hypothetical protein
MNIFNCIPFKNVENCDEKWSKFINRFNKDLDIYYQYIEPKISDLELFLSFQKELLIHQTKAINKLNINIYNYIPDEISLGTIMIIDNVLLYITSQELKIIQDQSYNINKCLSKLSNQKFLENASIELINNEKKKLIDFTNLQQEKIINDNFNTFGKDFIEILLKFFSLEKIYWHIQYYRENNCKLEEYSKEWFDYIYNDKINIDEITYLKTNI